jgi:hypothetical protein
MVRAQAITNMVTGATIYIMAQEHSLSRPKDCFAEFTLITYY